MGSQNSHENQTVTRQGTSMGSGLPGRQGTSMGDSLGRKGTSMGGFSGKFNTRAASRISSSLSRMTLESSLTTGTLQNLELDDETLFKIKATVNRSHTVFQNKMKKGL